MQEQNKLVRLTTVSNDVEREIIMGLLQAEHIRVMAQDAPTNCGLKPYLGQQARNLPGLDVHILVHEEDLAQAQAILAAASSISDEELEQQALAAGPEAQ